MEKRYGDINERITPPNRVRTVAPKFWSGINPTGAWKPSSGPRAIFQLDINNDRLTQRNTPQTPVNISGNRVLPF